MVIQSPADEMEVSGCSLERKTIMHQFFCSLQKENLHLWKL